MVTQNRTVVEDEDKLLIITTTSFQHPTYAQIYICNTLTESNGKFYLYQFIHQNDWKKQVNNQFWKLIDLFSKLSRFCQLLFARWYGFRLDNNDLDNTTTNAKINVAFYNWSLWWVGFCMMTQMYIYISCAYMFWTLHLCNMKYGNILIFGVSFLFHCLYGW